MARKNINRGFKKRGVWQDAVSLYVLACEIFANFPFELKKVAAHSIDAAHLAIKIIPMAAKSVTSLYKVYTFIGRLIRHIPDKHFPMIRYAGLFANRCRKQYLAQCRIVLNPSEPNDCDENTHENIHGEIAKIGPKTLDPNTEVIRF